MKDSQRNHLARRTFLGMGIAAVAGCVQAADAPAAKADPPPKALIDGTGPGWVELGADDFVHVNCEKDTWTWDGNSVHCTGKPVGVTRSKKPYTNFELVCQWRHNKHAGNSGIFVWSPIESLDSLKGPGLPHGIEVQVLDVGYAENYEKKNKKKSDWFTCHGDVFPVGSSRMTPFKPVSANGSRSFPSKNLSRPAGEWNHYYVRAINGEVRLWVNGEEVSGGNGCTPATGYLCLESEGAPIDFKGLKIRELP